MNYSHGIFVQVSEAKKLTLSSIILSIHSLFMAPLFIVLFKFNGVHPQISLFFILIKCLACLLWRYCVRRIFLICDISFGFRVKISILREKLKTSAFKYVSLLKIIKSNYFHRNYFLLYLYYVSEKKRNCIFN